jgi:YfiH family protein
MTKSAWYVPKWSTPANVKALVTTRGPVTQDPKSGFNIAKHVGDDEARVQANREKLLTNMPGATKIHWLNQIHSDVVANLDMSDISQTPLEADAAIVSKPSHVCAVMTADCLPVLFTNKVGTQVAAAHAGWRGLNAGILENTVSAFSDPASQLKAFLGPAISQMYFEVGGEVREAFLDEAPQEQKHAIEAAFLPSQESSGKYFGNLFAIARVRLKACGVEDIQGGGLCTYFHAPKFYSHRRDPLSGRFASLIYITSH